MPAPVQTRLDLLLLLFPEGEWYGFVSYPQKSTVTCAREADSQFDLTVFEEFNRITVTGDR